MKKIKITSEDEAFNLLKKLVDGFEIKDRYEIVFESWPRFVIRIKGEDFDGTIPTRIMPTLLELQKEVHKIYAKIIYDDESTKKLTRKDKEDLELLVTVDKGSSLFETILSEPIAKTLQGAITKMTPEQVTATLIVFGVSVTSVLFWKLWLSYRSKVKELDHKVELSNLEKEKMDIVKKASRQFSDSESVMQNMDNVRNDLLTKLKPTDNLEIDTGTEQTPYPTPVQVTGEQASQITAKPREKAEVLTMGSIPL